MKIIPPFPLSKLVQGFGANAVSAYSKLGLKGHPGWDFGVPWGAQIRAAVAAFCYSVMSKDNPNLMAYRAVFTIVDEDEFSYEISYGHDSDILINAGVKVYAEQPIAYVGNTGNVYVDGREVTLAEKQAGSYAGAHLHFQIRKLKKVPISEVKDTDHTINNGYGRYETEDGFCYIVPEYDNGYNGCVDPMQFIDGFIPPTPQFVFTKNLWLGMKNTDVLELQRRLGVDNSSAPGLFGPRTFNAAVAYQKSQGITATGFVGPLTRAALNVAVKTG